MAYPLPKIQNIQGVPSSVSVEEVELVQLTLLIELINMGGEGDVYLNCWCADEGALPYYPAARGIRLQNWRPAAAGEYLVHSSLRGLTDMGDPSGYGLCFGCNPDGDCWTMNPGTVKMRFETGYLTEDPAGGWDLLHKTDERTFSFNLGGNGLPWSTLAMAAGGFALFAAGIIWLTSRK